MELEDGWENSDYFLFQGEQCYAYNMTAMRALREHCITFKVFTFWRGNVTSGLRLNEQKDGFIHYRGIRNRICQESPQWYWKYIYANSTILGLNTKSSEWACTVYRM